MNGIGIVYWSPPHYTRETNPDQGEDTADYLLVEQVIIPGTGYRRNRSDRAPEALASRIGVVTNHIVLEGYIVFTTDDDKIFSYRTTYPISELPQPEPVELTTFYSDSPLPFRIRDIQGSFRSFAVFTASGSVLTASCPLLDVFHLSTGAENPLPHPSAIPGLQGQSVISIAFGDHHFHALHATGTITSYGTESQGCGALGLGSKDASKLRGVRSAGGFVNRRLKEGEGRTVWFDPMMHTWLQDMSKKGNEGEAAERARMIDSGHDGACSSIADYFENEGRKWEDGLTAQGEVGAYFVLKVSGAGWHSAALVLVDETKAEMARQKHLAAPPAMPPPPPNNEVAQPRPYGPAWFYMLLIYLVRTFLGLTARDATATENSRGRRRRQESHGGRRRDGSQGVANEALDGNQSQPIYTWAQDPFPRLRMANGEVMPGEIEITEVMR